MNPHPPHPDTARSRVLFHPLTRSLCAKLHRKGSCLFRATNFLQSGFECLELCWQVGVRARGAARLCLVFMCAWHISVLSCAACWGRLGPGKCDWRACGEVWRSSRPHLWFLPCWFLRSGLLLGHFSVSFCCHVLFPVDHALLLPPPDSTLLRFLITLTRSPLFVWVCTGGVGLCARALDWLAAEGW